MEKTMMMVTVLAVIAAIAIVGKMKSDESALLDQIEFERATLAHMGK